MLKQRRKLSRGQRDYLLLRTGVISVPIAFLIGLAAWGVPMVQHYRHDQLAQNRSHWHTSQGEVISRGPYQGDGGYESYRVVQLRYEPFRGEPAIKEVMVGWDTQVGDTFTVHARDDGRVFVPKAMNQPFGLDNSYDYNGRDATILIGMLLALLAGSLLTWLIVYRLTVVSVTLTPSLGHTEVR